MTPNKCVCLCVSAFLCVWETARDQSGFFEQLKIQILNLHHCWCFWSCHVNLISSEHVLGSLPQSLGQSGVLCHSALELNGRPGWGIPRTASRRCGRLTSRRENSGCTRRSRSGWSHLMALALWDGCSSLQLLWGQDQTNFILYSDHRFFPQISVVHISWCQFPY